MNMRIVKGAATKIGCSPEEWVRRTESGQKWCYLCTSWKPRTEFSSDRSRGDGLMSCCRPCNSLRSTASHYKMKPADLRAMFTTQEGRCAICEREGQKMEVDHDHDTGAVRALLCSRCNGALGQFCDDVALLKKAIAYLELHG